MVFVECRPADGEVGAVADELAAFAKASGAGFVARAEQCAAADLLLQMMPEQIRPALRAAFRRARLAGLSVDDCDRGLSGPDDAAEGSSGAS